MPICKDTVGSPSLRSISEICSSVMQIISKVNSSSIISSLSPIFTILQGSDKWLLIETGNSIIVCDDKNIQLGVYEVCTYILDHISSQHQELSMGLIRELLLICQLESGMTMSYVDFGHRIILCMMVCNTGADMGGEDKTVSARIFQ